MLFLRLLALFITIPLVELAILHYVAGVISLGWTIGLVLLTGFVGTALARREGWRTWRAIRSALTEGQLPTNEMLDGVLILLAGALLLTPGFLTDVVGLSLLMPFLRRHYRRWLVRWFKRRFRLEQFSPPPFPTPHQDSQTIDSYVVDRHDPKAPREPD